jgi:mannose-6-phosphate isomerase-like protein (cupin superfamily)
MSPTYNSYPYPHYVTPQANNTGNLYQTYPCPYYCNAQAYSSVMPGQFNNQCYPFNDKMEYTSISHLYRAENNTAHMELRDYGPEPFVIDIEEATKRNTTFRTALWTGEYLQITLMSINVGEDIGLEVHPDHDQFIRIEEGQGLTQMGDSKDRLDFQREVYDDYVILIPAGKWHNITNTGDRPLKLYSIYAPPEHPKGTVHETKAIAEAAEENHHR